MASSQVTVRSPHTYPKYGRRSSSLTVDDLQRCGTCDIGVTLYSLVHHKFKSILMFTPTPFYKNPSCTNQKTVSLNSRGGGQYLKTQIDYSRIAQKSWNHTLQRSRCIPPIKCLNDLHALLFFHNWLFLIFFTYLFIHLYQK